MPLDVTTEIIAVRERVARIETTLQQIQLTLVATKRSVEAPPPPARGIVIPFATITVLINVGVALLQHFL